MYIQNRNKFIKKNKKQFMVTKGERDGGGRDNLAG